jgi:GntR family transcriptional repressor for pyruvate dehydrogenase complex
MFETRLAIEPHIAALAAERATKEQIDQLAQEVAAMRAAVDTPELYQAHDVRFHRIVALAAGNPVLTALVEAITTGTISASALCQASGQPFDYAESTELHRKIYRAIRSHNPAEARLAMQRSLELSRAAIAAEATPVLSKIAPPPPAPPEYARIERFNPALQPAVRPFASWAGASSPALALRGAATSTG